MLMREGTPIPEASSRKLIARTEEKQIAACAGLRAIS
jgi:hypothetical protein